MFVVLLRLLVRQRVFLTSRMRGRPLWSVCVILIQALLLVSAASGAAATAAEFPNIAELFGAVNAEWGEPETVAAGGVPIRVQSFVSSAAVVDAARELTESGSVFQRILSMPGQLLLSGIRNNWHWLAVVREGAGGAIGYVSAMQVVAAGLGNRPVWLMPGATAVASISDMAADQSVDQHVHLFHESLDIVSARITKQLSRAGWKRGTGASSIGGQLQWDRGKQWVSVLVLPHPNGTVVFTQQQTRGLSQ